jgi:hypothetical protein
MKFTSVFTKYLYFAMQGQVNEQVHTQKLPPLLSSNSIRTRQRKYSVIFVFVSRILVLRYSNETIAVVVYILHENFS